MSGFLPPAMLEIMSKFDDTGVAKAMATMKEIDAMKATAKVKVDVDGRAELTALKAQIATLKDKSVKVGVNTSTTGGATGGGSRAGVEYADEFERAIRTRLAAAARSMPRIEVGAATTRAEQDIRDLSIRIAALRDARIGVDVDAGAAMVEIRALHAELTRLGAKSPHINIRVDAARASAELAALRATMERAGSQSDSFGSQIRGAASSAMSAIGSLSGLQWAILAIAAAAPMLAAALPSAAAAIMALGSAATSAAAGLATLYLGLSGPIKAVQLMGQANKAAAGGASDATSKFYRQASAADALASAERSLVSVQRDAARVQEDLTAAREAARRSIQDMNLDLADGDRAQRQGALNVRKALEDLRRVRADSSATRTEREQARLTYEQSQADLSRLGITQQRLATDTADANARGVEGSDQVRSAQEKILDTQERLIAATQAVAAAHRQVEQAAIDTGAAGGAAMDQLADAMAKLSPEGRKFAYFLRDLIDGPLAQLRRTAEAGFLPGLQRGMESLLPYFPQLNSFVGRLAATLGELAEKGLKSLTNPQWRAFFTYIANTAGPAITGMAKIVGNFAQGLASLMVAFGSTTKSMGDGLVGLSQKFANWAAHVSETDGFKKFIAYVQEYGPKLLEILANLGQIFIRIMPVIAKTGAVLIDLTLVITKLWEWITRSADATQALIGGLSGVKDTADAVGKSSILQSMTGLYGIMTTLTGKTDDTTKSVHWLNSEQSEAAQLATKHALAAVKQSEALKTVSDAADEVKSGFEKMTGVAKDQNEAMEDVIKSTADFSASVRENGTQLDLNTAKTTAQRDAILGTRDALESALSSVREEYFANIAAGMSLDQATKAHDNHIAAILREIPENQRNSAEVQNLVAAYGSIPGEVNTNVNVLGAEAALRQLQDLVVAKYAFEHGTTVGTARYELYYEHGGPNKMGRAGGGPIVGPGTSTSDSIPIWASVGEHMWSAAEVKAAGGHSAVAALRASILSGRSAALSSPVMPLGTGSPSSTVVHTHVHVMLDGREVAEVTHPYLIGVSQQHGFRSGVTGLA